MEPYTAEDIARRAREIASMVGYDVLGSPAEAIDAAAESALSTDVAAATITLAHADVRIHPAGAQVESLALWAKARKHFES